MKAFGNKKSISQKHIAVLFLFLSVISIFNTLIVYNEEIQERPLLASLSFGNTSNYQSITKHLTLDDNSIRIVARHEVTNADEIPLKLVLIKDRSTIYSDILKPKSTTGYSKPDFKKGLLGRESGWYWDYGTFKIPSKGNYEIRISPEKSLDSFDIFDVFLSTKNSDNIVYIWLFISISLLIVGLYFGRRIKITIK